MTALVDLRWLAGLLEGEGTFRLHRSWKSAAGHPGHAVIVVKMADRDVVAQVAEAWGVTLQGPYKSAAPDGRALRTLYSAQVNGAEAVDWMLRLYPFLGARRRASIRAVVSARWAYEATGRARRTS